MANPIDLITLSELETYLNGNSPSFNSGFTSQNGPFAITACSKDWLGFTGRRTLNGFVACNDFFDGAGGDRQFLREPPAAVVSAVYANGYAIPQGGYGTTGEVAPGWVLDSKRESISLIGRGPWLYGLSPGPGGAYAATGGPLNRVTAGWGFGQPNDANRQNVQVQYFGGGCIQFGENLIVPNGPYTVTVSQSGSFYLDLDQVYYGTPQNGQLVQFVQVASSPAQGQYSVANGVYTFNAADAGQLVSISYAYNDTPPDIKGWVLVQVAEMLEIRKQLGLKQQGGAESGTTSYRWDVPRHPMCLQVMLRYKRAMVGV